MPATLQAVPLTLAGGQHEGEYYHGGAPQLGPAPGCTPWLAQQHAQHILARRIPAWQHALVGEARACSFSLTMAALAVKFRGGNLSRDNHAPGLRGKFASPMLL